MSPLKSMLFIALMTICCASLACETIDDDLSEDDASVRLTNGTQTNGYPSVGYLLNGGSFCSATLISPKAVLTAAHCISSSSSTFTVGGKRYSSSRAVVHPLRAINDIAVVLLDNTVTSVTPSPLNISPITRGQSITIVGYGYTSNAGGNAQGSKYVGTNRISGFSLKQFYYSGDSNICSGDSGGPSFIGKKVAGVHSWGMGGGYCTDGRGADVRVDSYAKWIKTTAGIR